MKYLAGLLAMLLASPALADLVKPCESSAAPVPLSTTLMELMLGPLFENGVFLLLLGALAAVGVPWLLAGLAFAAVHFPARRDRD